MHFVSFWSLGAEPFKTQGFQALHPPACLRKQLVFRLALQWKLVSVKNALALFHAAELSFHSVDTYQVLCMHRAFGFVG